MSGQPLIHPNDASKYRSAYLATLGLQAQINAKNLNSNVVYKQTGTPAQPTDSRTTTEKLADIEKLKVELQGQLLNITDGTQTQKIISSLDDSEVQYLAQNMPAIIKDFRSRFAKGITAGVFLPMLRSMINQAVVFSGVSYGIKNIAGNSLVGTIGQFINSALTPIQYDLLEDFFQGDRDVVSAIGTIRDAYQQLPQMNEKLRALPLDGVRDVIQQLEYSFSDVPERKIIDQYLRQFRVGGQPAQQARQELGQILIDAEMLMLQNKPNVQKALEYNVQKYLMEDESFGIGSGDMGNSEDEQETAAPPSRRYGGGGRGRRPDIGVPDFDSGGVIGESNSSSTMFVPQALPVAPQEEAEDELPSYEELEQMSKEELYKIVSEGLSEAQRELLRGKIGMGKRNNVVMAYKAVSKPTLLALLSFIVRPVVAEAEGGEDEDIANALQQQEDAEKKIAGVGMRRIRGKGLVRKRQPIKTDGKVRVEREPHWTQLGDKLINTQRLQNNILSMRCSSGRNVEGFPVHHISHRLGGVLRKIVGGRLPDYDDIQILTEDERDELAKIGSISKINSKLNIPKKTKEQQEMLEFDILKGQVLAGNDNKGLLKRFKMMLIKFGDEGKLPKREVRDVLMTLASQGL